jgi:hypothetical protein
MPDIKGAEIFASGTWNGLDFTEDDLDRLVQSFEFFQLSGSVPLKLGHNDDQKVTDGQPALGWVDRIWRDGKKLLADFRDVPKVVHDAIRNGLYKHVSVELLRDVTAGTRTVPLVLDAVALLGADLPAVGTLKDLQALTMSALRGQSRERLAFTQVFTNQVGDHKHMAEKDTTQLEAELAALRAAKEQAERALGLANARAVQNEEQFTKLQEETQKAKVAAHRKTILDTFEAAVRSKAIQASTRERFLRFSKVETDDEACMRVPLSDVESYIRENPNPFIKSVAGTTVGGDPDEIPSGGLPDRELMARARKLCRDRGKNPEHWEDLKSAGIAIMRADPMLAERYRALPDDHADGKYSA